MAIVVLGSVARLPLPPPTVIAITATAAAAFLLREVRLIEFPLPQNSRLVPQFVTRVPFWGAVQFGAELGTGMRTFSPTGLPHILVVLIFFLGSWPQALLAGAGFALGRTAMVLSFLASRDKQGADRAFVVALPAIVSLLAITFAPLAYVIIGTDPLTALRYGMASLLGAAVVAKLVGWSAFRRRLDALLGSRPGLSAVAAVLIVVVESSAVVLAFTPAPDRLVGMAYAALGLAFTGLQTYWLAAGRRDACPCFADGDDSRVTARSWVRAVLVLVAGGLLAAAQLLGWR